MSSGLPEPSVNVAIKLASIAVHAEEMIGPGGHHFDLSTIQALLQDAEVVAYLAELDALALLPKKRGS